VTVVLVPLVANLPLVVLAGLAGARLYREWPGDRQRLTALAGANRRMLAQSDGRQ